MRRLVALLLVLCACGHDDGDVRFTLPDGAYWPDPRGYPGVGDGRIYVTNNFSDTVSILDLGALASGQLHEMLRLPVGLNPIEREGPHHLTVDPAGQYFYVGISNFVPASGSGPHGTHGAGTADGHVLKIRASDNVQVGTVRTDRNPGDVRLTPDGKLLLVSHFDALRIAEFLQGKAPDAQSFLDVFDAATLVKVAHIDLCPAAHGIGLAPDGSRAYVSCFDDHLAVVDLAHLDAPVARVPVIPSPGPLETPACEPYAMNVSPSGDSVWVSCFADGRLLRFDPALGAMDASRSIALGGRAVFGAFSPDGKTLFVPHQGPDGIAVIDPAAGTVQGTISFARDVCQNAHVVRFTPDERWLLAVCEGDHSGPGTMVLIDPAARAVAASTQLGVYPDDVGIIP